MSSFTGGQLVAKMLKAEGVEHVFTLSGLHIAPIYAGCVEEGIHLIDMRHEQAAAHAADATARLTRGIGVAVVTAGPGVTDAITGVANAFAASSPVLLIGGAAPISNQTRGSLQEVEQVDLFTRITRWSACVPNAELIPAYMAKAFRMMMSGRAGPVFLEIAWDVLLQIVSDPKLPSGYRTKARPAGDPAYIERAAEALRTAERAAIIAGSSVWWDDAASELRALAHKAAVPVFLNGAGRGALAPDDPCRLQHTRKEVLAQADVALVIGTPLDFRLGYGEVFGPATRIIQIDIDPTEIGRNRSVEIGITGDTKVVLSQLNDAIGKVPDRSARLQALRAREYDKLAKLTVYENDDAVPIHHSRLAKEISEVANADGRDPIFVADGGNYVAMAAKTIPLKSPGSWLDPGPLGCLGVGAPFAIAAKLRHPQRPVFVLQGDGSFGLNGFDFDTAIRFELPMVIVVGNDAAWGQIRLPQMAMYGSGPATKLAATRYDKVVEALGGTGELVTEPAAIRPALERALQSGTVACINVMIDPEAPAKSGMMGYAV
jgi:acetolactate synthase I/II/III large subunit